MGRVRFFAAWGVAIFTAGASVRCDASRSASAYLGDVHFRGEQSIEEYWKTHLLRPQDVVEAKRVIETRNKAMRTLQNADVVDPRGEWVSYLQDMRHYAGALTRLMVMYQIERWAFGGEEPSPVQEKVAGVQHILSGAAQEVKVRPHFSLGSRTNAFTRDLDFWLYSFLVNVKVHCNLGVGIEHFRTREQWNGADPRVELVRVEVERSVPVLGAHAAMSFGASTLRLTARIAKQLLPGFYAEILSVHGLNEQVSHLSSFGERQFRLWYGLRF